MENNIRFLQNRLSLLPIADFCVFLCCREDRAASTVINLNYWNFMEQLNRIELRGVVGSIRTQTFSDNVMARMTVATNYAYKDREGAAVIDTSWHNVVAWEGKNIHGLADITRGTKIHVVGRLRYQKYTGSDGVERLSTDIVASKVAVIDDPEPLQYEV